MVVKLTNVRHYLTNILTLSMIMLIAALTNVNECTFCC